MQSYQGQRLHDSAISTIARHVVALVINGRAGFATTASHDPVLSITYADMRNAALLRSRTFDISNNQQH